MTAMATPDKCCVGDCERNALASVGRDDLPGPLRLCATHTEQFRQSSEGWVIDWPRDAAAPTSVTAPGSENLWAYKRSEPSGPAEIPNGATPQGAGPLQRTLRAIEDRLAARRKSRK
jgi:hypothetical protein